MVFLNIYLKLSMVGCVFVLEILESQFPHPKFYVLCLTHDGGLPKNTMSMFLTHKQESQ